jgi:catabolite regulation protein CreA
LKETTDEAPARLPAAAGRHPRHREETREIGHVNTAITNLGLTRSHRVVVERFTDPDVRGVSCYISRPAPAACPACWAWRRTRPASP